MTAVFVLQERGWEYVARGVYLTEDAAHAGALTHGLARGAYEIHETELHS